MYCSATTTQETIMPPIILTLIACVMTCRGTTAGHHLIINTPWLGTALCWRPPSTQIGGALRAGGPERHREEHICPTHPESSASEPSGRRGRTHGSSVVGTIQTDPQGLDGLRIFGDDRSDRQIFANEMAGEKTGLEVDGSNSIENVNSKTHDQEGIPPDQQRLLFVREWLADEITLQQEPALFLALRLRGSIRIFADKIQDQEGIEDILPDQRRLLFVDKWLADEIHDQDYRTLQHEPAFFLALRLHGGMQIFANMRIGKTITLEVDGSDSIENVNSKIHDHAAAS